jgi:hypothetical protein
MVKENPKSTMEEQKKEERTITGMETGMKT